MEVENPDVWSNPPDVIRSQIAVVGSGPGGAVSSALLAEAGREVLLIEDGSFLSLESCPPFSREEMVQKYRNGGLTVTMGRTKIAYVEGRCVGGGSEINSGLYHRTPPEILEQWRNQYQVDGLTESELLPHFEANEVDLSVGTNPDALTPASLRLHQGAQKLGWKSLEIPRWFTDGVKQSMTRSFVPRLFHAGGRILPQTRVRGIKRRSNHWQLRAEHRDSNSRRRSIVIEAETVFLAAGAIQTPALLRRSGIRKNVGNALRLHPTIKIVAQFADCVNSAVPSVGVHQVKEFAPRFSFGCSVSSRPHLALAFVPYPEMLKRIDEAFPRCAIYYAMTCGGKGTIRTIPGFRDPLVRYRLSSEDWIDLTEATWKLAECLFAAGATVLFPSVSGIPQGLSIRSMEELKHALGPTLQPANANLMTIHLFSSCPMGENQTLCPVDSFGKVRGVEGLYVADASLLCTAPGVNPQGTVMAVARRNVNRFLKK